MTTEVAPLTDVPSDTTPSDSAIISVLVSSHGSTALAAERLHIPQADLIDRLPSIPYETLAASIRAVRLLMAYDSLVVMKDVVFETLPDLTPDARAKFLLQFMDRFEHMLAPPVQSEGAGSTTNVNVITQMNNETSDARERLLERLALINNNALPVDLARVEDVGKGRATSAETATVVEAIRRHPEVDS